MKYLSTVIISKTQTIAMNRTAFIYTRLSLWIFRKLQQTKNLVACRHSIHRNMEIGTKLTHRDEEIRRQQHDQQASCEVNSPARIFSHRNDHPQCRSEISNDIHNRDRIELHPQHFHCDLAETFRRRVHLKIFLRIRLINLERRQSLQIFEKSVTKTCILRPIIPQQTFRPGLHRSDRNRDQRHTHQKYQCRWYIHRA